LACRADALGLIGKLLIILGDVEKSAPSFDIAPSDGLRTGLSALGRPFVSIANTSESFSN